MSVTFAMAPPQNINRETVKITLNRRTVTPLLTKLSQILQKYLEWNDFHSQILRSWSMEVIGTSLCSDISPEEIFNMAYQKINVLGTQILISPHEELPLSDPWLETFAEPLPYSGLEHGLWENSYLSTFLQSNIPSIYTGKAIDSRSCKQHLFSAEIIELFYPIMYSNYNQSNSQPVIAGRAGNQGIRREDLSGMTPFEVRNFHMNNGRVIQNLAMAERPRVVPITPDVLPNYIIAAMNAQLSWALQMQTLQFQVQIRETENIFSETTAEFENLVNNLREEAHRNQENVRSKVDEMGSAHHAETHSLREQLKALMNKLEEKIAELEKYIGISKDQASQIAQLRSVVSSLQSRLHTLENQDHGSDCCIQ